MSKKKKTSKKAAPGETQAPPPSEESLASDSGSPTELDQVRRELESAETLQTAVSEPGAAQRATRATHPMADVVSGLEQILRETPDFAPLADLVLERLGKLGQGGMGAVYRVHDQRLDREAALKVIIGEAGEEAVARFRREAQVTARLDHPAIPPVYEAGTNASGQHYMLMRVIEGDTLSDRIKSHGRVGGWRDLLEVLVKTGEAVAYAHSRGVIHRDLKPDNVMVGEFGEVLVMDWGLARAESDDDDLLASAQPDLDLAEAKAAGLTQAGAVMGTPGYMPPEQAKGDPVDARADVFALGAILVEILTRRPPITGKTAINKLRATLDRKIALPRDRRQDVPPELNSIAGKALAFAREDRYEAEAFVADLKAYLSGADVSAHRYSAWERVKRLPRRHPVLVAGGVVGVVVASLLLALVFLAQGKANAEAATDQAKASEKEAETAREEAVGSEQKAKASEQKAKASEQKAKDSEQKAKASEQASRAFSDEGKVRVVLEAGAAVPARVEELKRWLTRADELLSRTSEHQARLEQVRDPRPGDSPEQDLDRQVEKAALESLVDGLKKLEPLPDRERARVSFAEGLREQTISGAEVKTAWEQAARAVRQDSRYEGLELEPLLGLVPLGPDPSSTLYEFWHVESGARPSRDEQGRHVVDETSGLVLVLIPGGTFRMGSEKFADERPTHEVSVKPFFLSKYEVSQAQWEGARGSNPSHYHAGTAGLSISSRHPVETVSWTECDQASRRWSLRLPSEAEWEYACRAGTSTPWWTGGEATSLRGAENLADLTLERHRPGTFKTERWSDGHRVHAPVGSFRANAFGLHDTAGNVLEWCQDLYTDSYSGAPSDGSSWKPAGASGRVCRGGGWHTEARFCRSASRFSDVPGGRYYYLGFRPTRSYP